MSERSIRERSERYDAPMLRTFLRRLLQRGVPGMLSPGERAPEFEAQDQRGLSLRAAELAGKRYVLWFYPKADTPG